MRTLTSTFTVVAMSVVLLLSSAGAASADVGSWSTPVDLSAAGGSAYDPQLVTDGTTITATWRRSDGFNTRIQVATSTDQGATWSDPVTLSDEGGNASSPQLVTDGTTITATWYRDDGSNDRIQTATSTDAGATWSDPVTLSDEGGNASSPQLVTDGTTITVVWQRSDGSNDRIQTATSADQGATWNTPIDLSDAGGDASSPQLVTDGTTITATWYRYDGSNYIVQVATSTGAGATWSAPIDLSATEGDASSPQLVTDGTTITATWNRSDGSNTRIQAATTTDAGATWNTPINLSAEGDDAYSPQLAIDGDTITAAWINTAGGTYRVQAATSTDAGATWNTPVTLSTSAGGTYETQLVTDGTTITVTWQRFDGSIFRVEAATSTDAGATWSAPIGLSAAGDWAAKPQLAADGTTITAAWYRNDGSNYRIQASSITALAELPEQELAATGAGDNLALGLFGGGLLVSGALVLLVTAQRRRTVSAV